MASHQICGFYWCILTVCIINSIRFHSSFICLFTLERLMQACQFSLFWKVEWCFLWGFGWRSSPLEGTELVAAQTRDGAWVESGCFRGSCGLETQHSSGMSSCVWPVRSFSALSVSNCSVIQTCPCRLCSLCWLISLRGLYKASICQTHCMGNNFNWIHNGLPIHPLYHSSSMNYFICMIIIRHFMNERCSLSVDLYRFYSYSYSILYI